MPESLRLVVPCQARGGGSGGNPHTAAHCRAHRCGTGTPGRPPSRGCASAPAPCPQSRCATPRPPVSARKAGAQRQSATEAARTDERNSSTHLGPKLGKLRSSRHRGQEVQGELGLRNVTLVHQRHAEVVLVEGHTLLGVLDAASRGRRQRDRAISRASGGVLATGRARPPPSCVGFRDRARWRRTAAWSGCRRSPCPPWGTIRGGE